MSEGISSDAKAFILGIFVIAISIGLVASIFFIGTKVIREQKYGNFQETIKDLSEEQKCIHICGFEFPGSTYLENYKFCMEKCDRISERLNTDCKA